MAAKVDRIQDEALRASLQTAREALRSGDHADTVRRASDAYLELLRRKPDLLEGPERLRVLLFFPRLGARLVVGPQGPEVIYDRETFAFSEAVTYYEFAVDSLVKQGL